MPRFMMLVVPGGKKSHFGPPTCMCIACWRNRLEFICLLFVVVPAQRRRDEAQHGRRQNLISIRHGRCDLHCESGDGTAFSANQFPLRRKYYVQKALSSSNMSKCESSFPKGVSACPKVAEECANVHI